MLTLHYQNIGVITAFLRAAEKTASSWPKNAIPALKNLIEEPDTGLQAVVDTLAAAMLAFHNKASRLGEQIADVIDDVEDGLKKDKDYTVPPNLAIALLDIRDLIRGPVSFGGTDIPFAPKTCWPSCSGSSSGFGGIDRPPVRWEGV